MTRPYLTKEDLTAMTGAKQRAGQIKFLQEHKIPHWTNAKGELLTTIRLFEDAVSGNTTRQVRGSV